MQFAPLLNKKSYAIDLKGITMGGQSIASARELSSIGGAMLDTGTTYTLLPSVIFRRLLNKLEECTRKDLTLCVGTWIHGVRSVSALDLEERCWKLSRNSDIGTFPPITIKTKGGELNFLPESYLYPRMRSRIWCLGLKEHPAERVILGATFFINRNVVFDLDNYRIGFADAQCPTKFHPTVWDPSQKTLTSASLQEDIARAQRRQTTLPVAAGAVGGIFSTVLSIFLCLCLAGENKKGYDKG